MNNIASIIAQFYTAPVQDGQNGKPATSQNSVNNGGFDFWATMLGQIGENGTNDQIKGFTQIALGAEDGEQNLQKLEQLFGLNLGELSTQGKIGANTNLDQLIAQAEALGRQMTFKNENLSKAVQDQGIFDSINAQMDVIQQQLALVQDVQNTDQPIPVAALVISGISPAQLGEIQGRIQELETKLGRDITVEDIIAGVGGIMTDHDNSNGLFPFVLQIVGGKADFNNQDQLQALAAQMNSVQPGGSGSDGDNTALIGLNGAVVPSLAARPEAFQGQQDLRQRMPNQTKGMEGAGIGKGASAAGNPLSQASVLQGLTALNGGDVSQNGSQLSQGFDGLFFADDGALFFDGEFAGFSPSSSQFLNTVSQAANALTYSGQKAGQAHPATEMVSARLQQAAQNGQTQNLILQLDPAELGRVEVRLEFGKDKMVKANMLVEKPETLILLQRDSAALERALHNSGLELDGGGIDFSLAEDGSAFEQNNEGKGGGKFGNGSNDDDQADLINTEIIETAMTWQVDANTGHTHYSILA